MRLIILVIGVLFLGSCESNSPSKQASNYEETQLSFLDLRFGYDVRNQWLRKPENILMLHETFKKIGYENLITDDDWISNPILSYSYINNSLNVLVDSLELTYQDYLNAPQYYSEFWKRRIKEGNEKAVYYVLNEVKQIMIEKAELELNIEIVNDTLERLISFEYPSRELSDAEANEHLNYLIKIGLHQSAYNLLTNENSHYYNVKWDKQQELMSSLRTTKTYQRPWFEDDTP